MRISGRDTENACESVGVTQETHDHNYFRTRNVVNKVHPKSGSNRRGSQIHRSRKLKTRKFLKPGFWPISRKLHITHRIWSCEPMNSTMFHAFGANEQICVTIS